MTNVFTFGGKEDDPADVGSLSPTRVEARAPKRYPVEFRRKCNKIKNSR